jgi:hypothetical protein
MALSQKNNVVVEVKLIRDLSASPHFSELAGRSRFGRALTS